MSRPAVVACESCKGFAEETKRLARFRIDGVSHIAPDMWMAGRTFRGQRSYLQAMHDWADGCRDALAYEAQKAKIDGPAEATA